MIVTGLEMFIAPRHPRGSFTGRHYPDSTASELSTKFLKLDALLFPSTAEDNEVEHSVLPAHSYCTLICRAGTTNMCGV